MTVISLKKDRLTVISAGREHQRKMKATSWNGGTAQADSDQLNVRHGLYCDQLEGRHGAGSERGERPPAVTSISIFND
jgi:hypothetical protein